jgi:hypothetical protein
MVVAWWQAASVVMAVTPGGSDCREGCHTRLDLVSVRALALCGLQALGAEAQLALGAGGGGGGVGD